MWKQRILGILFAGMLAALPLVAQGHWMYPDALTRDQILATIIGNTMTGSLEDGSTYTEYYAADGTIHGTEPTNGAYEGRWSIRDDDAMCWSYAPDYAVIGCVLLYVEGDTVSFQLINGETEPAAMLHAGNPFGL